MQDNNDMLIIGGLLVIGTIDIIQGAVYAGIQGSIGKYALSFFDPAMISNAGTFSTFASLNLIAFPIAFVPCLLLETLVTQNDYLKQHPNIKNLIKTSGNFLIGLSACALAATFFATPITANLACVMVLPTLITSCQILGSIINIIADAIHENNRVSNSPHPSY